MSNLERRKEESLAGHADRLASMDLSGWPIARRAEHAHALARARALAQLLKQKRKLSRAAAAGGIAEPAELRREPWCVICGQALERNGAGARPLSLPIPPGLVCRVCFAAGPAAAAVIARTRAARERASARSAEASSDVEHLSDVLEAVREYADFLDALADRLEVLDTWPKVMVQHHRPRKGK